MRSLWSSRTWLSLAYVALGLPFGILTFTVVIVGFSVGAALVPAFLLGLVVLFAMVYVVRALAAVERGRAGLFFDVQLPGRPPARAARDGIVQRTVAEFTSAGTWKEFAYCLALLPVGVFSFVVVISVWAIAVSGLTLPLYGPSLPGGEITSWVDWPDWVELTVGCCLGLLALVVAPLLTQLMANAELGMLRGLLVANENEMLRAQVSSLQTSRARVVDAADAERRRIERDLHDGAQQQLVALAMNLGRAKEKLDHDPEAARELIAQAHQEAKESITELRNVIRGVHPAVLTDRGLDAALSALAARSPVPVRVNVDLSSRPSPTAEAIAYFVVSEALTNVARHSGATRVDVHVERDGDRLLVAVADNGAGGATETAGSGLAGLRDRVAAVDGTFYLTSPPRGGTTVAVEVPCES